MTALPDEPKPPASASTSTSTSAPAGLVPTMNGSGSGPTPPGPGPSLSPTAAPAPISQSPQPDSLPNVNDLEAKCGGCHKLIDQESGGVVVAFGSSLWHVDCFRCAKCKDRVSADTNLLLLSDGSPVCGNCSYQCFVCKQAITEEAIMTGDESYHAHCFTCRTCKRRIEELVFAKTSQGIYCMACHNERVAKSRRHAEAKRQRAARKAEREEREALHPNGSPSPSATPNSFNSGRFDVSPQVAGSDEDGSGENAHVRGEGESHGGARQREPSTDLSRDREGGRQRELGADLPRDRELEPERERDRERERERERQPSTEAVRERKASASGGTPGGRERLPSGPYSELHPGSRSTPDLNIDRDRTARAPSPRQPPSPSESIATAKADRAVSPSGSRPIGLGVGPVGLGVPTTKADRRRSINPGMTFNMDAQNSTFAVEPRMSPLPPSPLRASFTDLQAVSPTSPIVGTEFPFRPSPNGTGIANGNGSSSGFGEARTPRLVAPDLPPMTFSLSDPDFAVILNNIDRSPTDRIPLNDDTHSLSPNQAPILRTRQPSAESTHSVASRLGPDSSFATLIEIVATAKHNGSDPIPVELGLLVGLISEMEEMKQDISGLRAKYSGAKRSSQQYSEGLTVAGEEYDKEVALRRELEAEITRLKAQVHSQTARLSVISGDERRQENMRRRSHDLANSLTGLERDISRLRAQRDMTLAEVEALNAGADEQSLTSRLDTIKEQYREELEPLTAQREALQREIADLRETREQFLEESTALAAKNDELVELNQQLARQAELLQERRTPVFPKRHPSGSPSLSSLATSATLQEVPEETARVVKVTKPEPIEQAPARRFKWYKSSKGPDAVASISRPLPRIRPSTEFAAREHTFTQHSTMRFTRCELCAEKMWGLQEVRCSACGMVCHSKCAEKLPKSCTGRTQEMEAPILPTMFGRELAEQVVADQTSVPVIVTKCIGAVEAVGMTYEGIYRKTGGSSQSKQIQQLFERGDYDSFDLLDVERFNDISSVTSVLKTYFRQLPDPLLTHALHESFVAAANIRDSANKHTALCALLKELPREHYNTLRTLMLHLNRVTASSGVNLMTSQNLGVVFGPTLMRSSDPNREFGDMAGKALSVQWMVDNAPQVFAEGK